MKRWLVLMEMITICDMMIVLVVVPVVDDDASAQCLELSYLAGSYASILYRIVVHLYIVEQKVE